MKAPPRGEVWLVDLGLVAKIRPGAVISVPTEDSDRSLVTLVPHTTSARGSRFEVTVQSRFLKPGAFDAQGIITVPHARLIRRIGLLAPIQMQALENAVRAWLGIGDA